MAPSSSNAAGHTPVFITAAVRTPIAAFQGAIAEMPGPKLGAIAIKEAVLRAGRGVAEKVDEVIMGEVLTAGVGQAPARQAAIFAGLSSSVPCMTVNKVCGSGFTTARVGAIRKACERAGLTPDHIDLFEINEAFAAVTMVAMKDLNKQNLRQGDRHDSRPQRQAEELSFAGIITRPHGVDCGIDAQNEGRFCQFRDRVLFSAFCGRPRSEDVLEIIQRAQR